jgi:hypothetical protein
MKIFINIISVLVVIFSIMTSSANAGVWDEQGLHIKTGKIIDVGVKMGYERGDHLMWMEIDEEPNWELNDTTYWLVKDFNQGVQAAWEIGDRVKIYFDPEQRYFFAINLDKPGIILSVWVYAL